VLGKPLHHNPTRGGPSELARHIEQYERTLVTYAECFGHAPPADIWQPADVRFATDSQQMRVNRKHVWLVPKPRWPRQFVGSPSLVAGAVSAPFLVGVANPFNLTGPNFLIFYGMVCAAAVLAAYALRQLLRDNTPTRDEPKLNAYDIACLAGGVPGVLRACLASLIVNGRLKPVVGEKLPTFRAKDSLAAVHHDIERIMLGEAAHENGATVAALLDRSRNAGSEVESALQGQGLMETRESIAAARWAPILLLSAVFLIGFVKVFVGVERDKPVVFLIVMVVALGILMALYFWRVPLRTRRGEELLRKLKNEHSLLRSIDLTTYDSVAGVHHLPGELLLAAGLFGLTSLHHPDIVTLNKSLKPLSASGSSTSGCGAATGCGGGGGGGGGCGGGGCGGCGGGD
jgi:uncharacterized protein (TIGR04222 family)